MLHREYAREIAAGLRSHYHGCHIGQWCRDEMSSRELITLVEGMPPDSWLKTAMHFDAQEAVGNDAKAAMDEVRDMTQKLLRGEVKTRGAVVEIVNGGRRTRKRGGTPAAQPQT